MLPPDSSQQLRSSVLFLVLGFLPPAVRLSGKDRICSRGGMNVAIDSENEIFLHSVNSIL